ncbi:MAG TPA: hypothetical protein VHN14_21390 [Kofleriaceae bacterium]|jgi:hypothetical protein|nr:hypothetical protein [Kofleriaceae bacterium]
MVRLVITLALLGSCSSTAKTGSTTGTREPPVMAKRVALSWGIEQHGETADIFLATTDETGKQISHPLGRYKGECTVMRPAREMNAVTGVACRTGGTGTELHAVIQRGQEVVILKLGIDPGVTPDPMAREEVMRVTVPLGAQIEVGT